MEEAKQTCRLSQSDTTHDNDLTDAIDAATEQVEQDTDRAIITQTFVLTSDGFPNGSIELAQKPIQSVESITYDDPEGVAQTIDPSEYALNLGNRQVYRTDSTSWPTTSQLQESARVEYKAGYGDSQSNVPRLIKRAVLLQVARWFFDPAMESSENQDVAYERIIRRILRTTYP